MTRNARLRRDRLVVAAVILSALGVAAMIAIVVVGRFDISAARDFRADATVRDFFPPQAVPATRFIDPSPFAVWLPSDLFVVDSIRSGRLPLWDRRQGGGFSPVVQFQTGVLHPLRWFVAVFPRESVPSVLILLSLYAGGLGCFLWCLTLRLGLLTSASGALLFVLSPGLVSMAHFSGALLPYAHLPWLLLGWRWLARTGSPVAFGALATLFGSLFLSGHPSIALAVCFGVTSVVAFDAIVSGSWKFPWRLAVTATVGLMIAAVGIVPSIVAIPHLWTYKTATAEGVDYEPSTLQQWVGAVQSVVLDTYGPACCVDLPPFYQYLGLGSLLLIAAAFPAASRDPRLWPTVVLFLVWFAVTVPGPWMAPLGRIAPLAYIKPWYYVGLFDFFAAVTAAVGLSHLLTRSRLLRIGGSAVVIAAMASYAVRSYPVFAPERWTAVVTGPVIEFLRSGNDFARVTAGRGQVLLPNTAALTGIEDARLTGPLLYERYRLWWMLVDPLVERRFFPTARLTDRLDSPLIGDFNIKYVLQCRYPWWGTFHTFWHARRDSLLSPWIRSSRFAVIAKSNSVEIRRDVLGRMRPRAHFAEKTLEVRSLAEAFSALARDRNLAARVAVVETGGTPLRPREASGEVVVRYPTDSSVRLETRSRTGGLVVLHDTYAPGWRATVDGREAKIHPVNILSRGVVVPAGSHVVEMTFLPPGLPAGAVISGATLVALVIFAFSARRKGGARRPQRGACG
ncbi:MAG TPA: YfhO family protein [Thermoanaerobaculia bacterium]|nr:YfhO family protein [Thermoanaerobaculia bacterium]